MADLLMSLVVGIVAGVIANMLYDRIRHWRHEPRMRLIGLTNHDDAQKSPCGNHSAGAFFGDT